MSSVLVTGGAGYVGSHAVKSLVDAGHRVIVSDALVTGHEAAVIAAGAGRLIIGARNPHGYRAQVNG